MTALVRRAQKRLGTKTDTGFTVLEVTVAMFVFSVIVVGIVAMQISSLRTVSISRARTQATELANRQMEYIRALRYDDVGIINAPPGEVSSTVGVPASQDFRVPPDVFTVMTHIHHVDDPADGISTTAPIDTEWQDYKRVEIIVSWQNLPRVTRLVSFVHPVALNADAHQPPQIVITSPTIDGSTFSDSDVNALGSQTRGFTTSPNLTSNQIISVFCTIIAPDLQIHEIPQPKCQLSEVLPAPSPPTHAYDIVAHINTLIAGNGGLPLPDSPFTATGPQPYRLRFRAVDEQARDNTDERRFYVDNTAPTAGPANLQAVLLNLANPVAQLTWDRAEDATGIREYQIFRREVAPTVTPYGQIATRTVALSEQGRASFTYFDTTIQSNRTYEYFVVAIDFGSHASAPSNTAIPPAQVGPPLPGGNQPPEWPAGAAVTGTFSRQGGRNITLRWENNPAFDRDQNFTNNFSPPAGYHVDRYSGGTNETSDCAALSVAEDASWVRLTAAPLLPTAIEYVNTSVTADQWYCYRIHARDSLDAPSPYLFLLKRASE